MQFVNSTAKVPPLGPGLSTLRRRRAGPHVKDRQRSVPDAPTSVQVAVMSDLHLEFYGDLRQHALRKLAPRHVDICVLAGDIDIGPAIDATLTLWARETPDVDIVYVPGNHDYYNAERADVEARLRNATSANPNLHVLLDDIATLHGLRFVGTTLWFPLSPTAKRHESGWSDFRAIPRLADWVYEANADAHQFLEANVVEGDIVVTHMLPHERSVAPVWRKSWTNSYFVSPCEKVFDAGPRYWIHGHTHSSMRYSLGATEVVCNPRGYFPSAVNPDFDARLTLTVDSR